MPSWWFSPSGRTRRPRGNLGLPGDPAILTPSRRHQVSGWFLVRLPYVALLVGLTWLTGYLLTAPEFVADDVGVAGNALVPTEQVLAGAGATGQNVFLLGSSRVEKSVLAIRPIRSAHVTFGWPNKVRLEVTERRPFAIWRVADSSYLVSEEGVVLAPVSGETLALAIADLDGQPVRVGDVLDRDLLGEADHLLTALRGAGVGVRSLEYSRVYGLIAPSDRGVRIAFGRGRDMPGKVTVLRALLDELAAQPGAAQGAVGAPVQFVDLRIRERPYFR